MKRLLLISFCLIYILSCKKDNAIDKSPYIGKWELSKTTSSGFAIDTIYNKNNGNIIIFNSDNSFINTVINTDTSYTMSDTYKLEKGAACIVNESSVPLLILNNGETYVAIIQDSFLLLSTRECADYNHTDYYLKIK